MPSTRVLSGAIVMIAPPACAEAAIRACYVFTDRFYVLLGRAGERLEIQLRSKIPGEPADLESAAGDLLRELSSQTLRSTITRNDAKLKEQLLRDALSSEAAPEPSLTEEQQDEIQRLIAEVEEELGGKTGRKALSDPLGIAESWEGRGSPRENAE